MWPIKWGRAIQRLYYRLFQAFERRLPGIVFGYSFMIALAQRPESGKTNYMEAHSRQNPFSRAWHIARDKGW